MMRRTKCEQCSLALLFIILSFVWIPSVCEGVQFSFEHEVQVSHGGNISGVGGVAVRGQRVYALWADRRDVYPVILFARSIDGGETFENETLVNESGTGEFPALESDRVGDVIWVIWDGIEWGGTARGIYFDRSVDGGATFGVDQLLSDSSGGYYEPDAAIASDGHQFVVVGWIIGDSVYVRRSFDAGASFDSVRPVAAHESGPFSVGPFSVELDIAPSGSIGMSYMTIEGDLGAQGRFHSLVSHDDAMTFEETGISGTGWVGSFAISNTGTFHQIASRERPPVYDNWPWYARSIDDGHTWTDYRELDVHQTSGLPQVALAARHGVVGAAWTRPHDPSLVFAGSLDDGVTFLEMTTVSPDPNATAPAVDIGPHVSPYVLFAKGELFVSRGRYPTSVARRSIEDDNHQERVSLSVVTSPNPSSDTFQFSIRGAQRGRSLCAISIHAADGRLVWRASVSDPSCDPPQAFWDGCDMHGNPVASGIYFVRVVQGGTGAVDRLVVVR